MVEAPGALGGLGFQFILDCRDFPWINALRFSSQVYTSTSFIIALHFRSADVTRHSLLTQLARNLALAQYNKGRMVFVSAEFGSKLDIQNVARWIFFLFLNSFVKIYLRRI